MIYRGRCWLFGDSVANDGGLMPLAYVKKQLYDPGELAPHCFEDIRPELGGAAKPHDLVFAGRNFAQGNAHIMGFLGLKGLALGVVAESIPRGSLRCAVNAGVPILPGCPGLMRQGFEDGDRVEVDFETGAVTNITKGKTLHYPPLPAALLEIIQAGGGSQYAKDVLLK